MEIGDDALAAGMTLVNGATAPANTIDTLLNETRDFIALGKLKDGVVTPAKLSATPIPVAKGGTGGTTAQEARNALGAVEQAGATLRIRWDAAAGNFVPAVDGTETSYLLRKDQADALYLPRGALREILATLADLSERVAALEAD